MSVSATELPSLTYHRLRESLAFFCGLGSTRWPCDETREEQWRQPGKRHEHSDTTTGASRTCDTTRASSTTRWPCDEARVCRPCDKAGAAMQDVQVGNIQQHAMARYQNCLNFGFGPGGSTNNTYPLMLSKAEIAAYRCHR